MQPGQRVVGPVDLEEAELVLAGGRVAAGGDANGGLGGI